MHQSYSNDSLCHWNHSILMISLTASSSKVLKEALLVFLLGLAGNHEQKMFQIEQKMCKGTKVWMGTKNVHGNKKCSWKQKMCKGTKMFIKASVVYCGLVWLNVAFYGLVRHFLPCMASYGLTLSYMAFLSSFMVKYRLYWTCIVFSRGHRAKFIWSCSVKHKVILEDTKY